MCWNIFKPKSIGGDFYYKKGISIKIPLGGFAGPWGSTTRGRKYYEDLLKFIKDLGFSTIYSQFEKDHVTGSSQFQYISIHFNTDADVELWNTNRERIGERLKLRLKEYKEEVNKEQEEFEEQNRRDKLRMERVL